MAALCGQRVSLNRTGFFGTTLPQAIKPQRVSTARSTCSNHIRAHCVKPMPQGALVFCCCRHRHAPSKLWPAAL